MSDRQVILAVDDNSSSLQLVTSILTEAGYKALPANGGELALKAATSAKPDLILLDVRMPGIGGLEVCRRIKENPDTTHIPIILISAFADVSEWADGLRLGAADYVSKPFQAEELLTRVKTHLELGKARTTLAFQEESIRHGEEERRDLKRMMAQTQRLEAVGTLAAGVAHEINNPLNIIMNYAELIQDESDQSAAVHEFASAIFGECQRMAKIVRNLLSFSRDEQESTAPLTSPLWSTKPSPWSASRCAETRLN